MIDAFTMNNSIPMERFFVDDSAGGLGTFYSFDAQTISHQLRWAHMLIDSIRMETEPDHLPPLGISPSSGQMWLAYSLEAVGLAGLRVIIFGSMEPWAECLCLAAGAAHVTTVDYNRLHFEHPHLTTLTVADLLRAPAESLRFDVRIASCMLLLCL